MLLHRSGSRFDLLLPGAMSEDDGAPIDAGLSRRRAIGGMGAVVVAGLAGHGLISRPLRAVAPSIAGQPVSSRVLAPREELVNTLEFAVEAAKVLPPATLSLVSGGDRSFFDRITFRPRILVPALEMDLGVELFGYEHFTPILVAPIADQQRFHPEGEPAVARGSSAGRALMIVSSRSSVPVDRIADAAGSPFWFQVYADDPAAAARVDKAVDCGAAAVVVTVGSFPAADGDGRPVVRAIRWDAVTRLRRRVDVPLVIKGVTTVGEAAEAVRRGAQGIVVSNYGGLVGDGNAMILALPDIVDSVGGAVPVLIDGAFRRGTDILKALALGARAVLIGRPVVWGLASYGEAGVQSVIEMLQAELARCMAMSGRPTVDRLDRSLVRLHGPVPGNERRAGGVVG